MTPHDRPHFASEHEFAEPLLAEHALGTLDPSDGSRVDDHLVACAACRTTLAELADAVAGLEQAVATTAVAPRAGARESLVAAARRTPQDAPRGAGRAEGAAASRAAAIAEGRARRSGRWRRRELVLAPSLVAVVLLAVVWNQASRIDDLQRDLDTARGDQVPVLKGASVDEFEIGGPFGDTRAGVVLKRDAGIVTFRKVPAPPDGMAWHVWAVDGDDDEIVELGTIASARDLAILPIEGIDPKDVTRIIVTTEAVAADGSDSSGGDAQIDPRDVDEPVAEGTI